MDAIRTYSWMLIFLSFFCGRECNHRMFFMPVLLCVWVLPLEWKQSRRGESTKSLTVPRIILFIYFFPPTRKAPHTRSFGLRVDMFLYNTIHTPQWHNTSVCVFSTFEMCMYCYNQVNGIEYLPCRLMIIFDPRVNVHTWLIWYCTTLWSVLWISVGFLYCTIYCVCYRTIYIQHHLSLQCFCTLGCLFHVVPRCCCRLKWCAYPSLRHKKASIMLTMTA